VGIEIFEKGLETRDTALAHEYTCLYIIMTEGEKGEPNNNDCATRNLTIRIRYSIVIIIILFVSVVLREDNGL